jgi:hypothetical protein
MKAKAILFLGSLFVSFALRVSGANAAEHIMTQARLHFDEPASSSFTAEMTEDEFNASLDELKRKVGEKYATLSDRLGGDARVYLEKTQEAWEDFAVKYERALKLTLDSVIKVFYKVYGKERFTNPCRELVLAVYRHRVIDLGRWERGEATSFKSDKNPEEWRAAFNLKRKSIVYATPEKYRPEEYAAVTAWRVFRDAQLVFAEALCGREAALNEDGLTFSRMLGLMLIQYEALAFFRTEREE